MTANSTRFLLSHSILAPRSSITLSPRIVGKNDAIAGRSMPGSVLSTNLAIAIRAPVFPADTTQAALPCATASMASRMLEFRPAAQSDCRLGIVADGIRRMMNRGDALKIGQVREQRLYPLFVAEEQIVDLRATQPSHVGTRDNHFRRMISAHGIKGDRQTRTHRIRTP